MHPRRLQLAIIALLLLFAPDGSTTTGNIQK
jgi:hypothetical protein